MLSRPKILVTGRNGLLARHLLRELAVKCELQATTHVPPKDPTNGVSYHNIDFSTNWTVEALPRKIDAVIHLAQASNMRNFPDGAQEIFDVNTHAVSKLLDYAFNVGAKRFIFASTGGLYAPSSSAKTEDAKIHQPQGSLGACFSAKRCSEILVQSYKEQMQTIILRPFFIYGPGQRENMLVPRLISNIQKGSPS